MISPCRTVRQFRKEAFEAKNCLTGETAPSTDSFAVLKEEEPISKRQHIWQGIRTTEDLSNSRKR
jgi:hypothetical protein